jgi:hypothetical protein
MSLRQVLITLGSYLLLGLLHGSPDVALGWGGSVLYAASLLLPLLVALHAGYVAESWRDGARRAFILNTLGIGAMLGIRTALFRYTSTECYYCPPLSSMLLWLAAATLVGAAVSVPVAAVGHAVRGRGGR